MPQIVVEREEGSLADRFRPYKVIIDGVYRGAIRNKEKWAFAVPAGTHTVRFCIDYYRSPPLKVVVVNRTRLICRSSVAHALGLMAVFAPNSWISIREEDEVAETETQYPADLPPPKASKKPREPRQPWRLRRPKLGADWSFRLAGPKTDSAAEASRQFEMDLREAVATRAFDVRYEPQIDLRNHQVAAFEALLRWKHPVRGLVPAREFIKLAEQLDLIEGIGQAVLEEVCQEAVNWPGDIRIAVNVSEYQFLDGAWPAIVAAALKNSGLSPSRLELEVSASIVLRGNAQAMAALQALRQAGVRIAVDVFGAEALQWARGRSLPFDKIKTRRTLLQADDEESAATLAATIDMCLQSGLACCAVGVETPEQLSRLVSGNCLQAQGHLFGQPLAARDIPNTLSRLNVGDWAPGKATIHPQQGVSFFQMAELANDVFIVTTAELDEPGPHIVYVNPAFTRLTGYSTAEAVGRSPRMLQGPGTSRATLDAMRHAMREGRVVHEKILNYAKCGAPYWLDVRIVPLRAANGSITHFAAIERDITLDKRRLDELEVLENRDVLTGIPNRRALMRVIEAEIETAQGQFENGDASEGLCVACIGIADVDALRDKMGEAGVHAVIQGLAERLADNVRRSDTLGRIEGGVFGICMPAVSKSAAEVSIERLRIAAASRLATFAGPVSVNVQAGVTAFAPGDSLTRVIHRADAAMRTAQEETAVEPATLPARLLGRHSSALLG